MSQTSFSLLLINGFKHIGTIPPFSLNVLLLPSLELTLIGPLAQCFKLPLMPFFSITLDTLEQSRHFPSLPSFDLVLDICELTPIGPLAQYPELP